jgi:uncharacterized protein YkwD
LELTTHQGGPLIGGTMGGFGLKSLQFLLQKGKVFLVVFGFAGLWGCQEVPSSNRSPSGDPPDPASTEETVMEGNQNGELLPPPVEKKEASGSIPIPDESQSDLKVDTKKCERMEPSICAVGLSLLDLVNKERQRVGVQLLDWSPSLAFVACDWSKAQGSAGKMSHDGFPEARDNLLEKEFPASVVEILGENVAYGQFPRMKPLSPGELAQIFYDIWKNSPSHYRNMISLEFQAVGMGFSLHDGKWYGTQIFGKHR